MLLFPQISDIETKNHFHHTSCFNPAQFLLIVVSGSLQDLGNSLTENAHIIRNVRMLFPFRLVHLSSRCHDMLTSVRLWFSTYGVARVCSNPYAGSQHVFPSSYCPPLTLAAIIPYVFGEVYR